MEGGGWVSRVRDLEVAMSTKFEALEQRVVELERALRFHRESDVRLWRNIQTIAKYLNIRVDEEVFGIKKVETQRHGDEPI